MPVYEYLCDSCGPFTDMRPMAECELPQDCPDCGAVAPRVILPAPNMIQLEVVNGGPDPITIAQVLVDEAYWQFSMEPAGTLERLQSA